jgi:predicted dehydrogenase
VLGRPGYTAPSDRLQLAAIGAGGKGRSDIANAANKGENNVVALCDVDYAQAKSSFDAFPQARQYRDFRVMLDEMGKDIDAVTISTPDHTHAVAAMACMELGKHVYVQKPLTHNIYEARMLTEAANKYKVVTQMGNQGASNPEQQIMIDWLENKKIGNVHSVNIWTNRPVWPQGIPAPADKPPLPESMTPSDWDLFVGPAQYVDYHPLFHPFKWRGWWNFGTGALGDMGCHLIGPAYNVLGLGYPSEVECSVGQVFVKDWQPEHIPEGCPPSSVVQISFPESRRSKSAIKLTWSDGGLRPFHPDHIPASDPLGDSESSNGIILIGNKGVITCGTHGQNPRMYLKNGDKITGEAAELPEKIRDLREWGHQVRWADACKAGFGSTQHRALTSSFDDAGPLTEIVLMGNLAIRSYGLRRTTDNDRFEYYGRKKLQWDGPNMSITNFEEGNQFVKREYRSGWTL